MEPHQPFVKTKAQACGLSNEISNFSLKDEIMDNLHQICAPAGGRGVRGGHLGRRR